MILDQWDVGLGDDLGAFMEHGIVRSKRVILICSTNYIERANAGRGGVGYEKLIVTQEVLQHSDTNKFIPLVRCNPDKTMPNFIGARSYIDFNELLTIVDGTMKPAIALEAFPGTQAEGFWSGSSYASSSGSAWTVSFSDGMPYLHDVALGFRVRCARWSAGQGM